MAFVWHHHQAPTLLPDGKPHSTWAVKHLTEGLYYNFTGGPYAIHLEIHRRHPEVRDVDHFSPSLLEAWNLVIEGVIDASPTARSLARRVIEELRALVASGRVEPLASVYAHTVQGYMLRLFESKGLGWFAEYLLEWELELGARIVERCLGVRPRGVWTPEMFWDQRLSEIYRRKGFEYTVLCDQHFAKAVGDKRSIYEPYVMRDTGLKVFFRDRQLSDWISFMGDPGSEYAADLEARRFIVALFERLRRHPGGVVVIALDGENWMFMPSAKRYAPYFLDRVYAYLEANSEYFETVTLSDVLGSIEPTRQIATIPWGSWVGLSASQWTGNERDELWEYVVTKLRWVAALLGSLPEPVRSKLSNDPQSPVYRALLASAIAIDSDFFWYAWKEPERTIIKSWADEAERVSKEELSKLEVVIEQGKRGSLVRFKSALDYPLRVTVECLSGEARFEIEIPPYGLTQIEMPCYEVAVKAPPVILAQAPKP